MIHKSQVLSTVQQIKLRKLELEIEALREQIQGRGDCEAESLARGNVNCLSYKGSPETISHLT